jgi:drug/metabolite transporter (DMT)-like permease
VTKADTGWREPAARIPLRWGGYRARYLAAIALILAGGLLIQASSFYSQQFLAIGAAAHLAGWWILPGRGWQRLWASIPSVFVMILLLTGGLSFAALVIPLAGWLWLRERPGLSYLALIGPLAAGILLGQAFPQYGSGAIVVTISVLVMVGSAWLARLLADK